MKMNLVYLDCNSDIVRHCLWYVENEYNAELAIVFVEALDKEVGRMLLYEFKDKVKAGLAEVREEVVLDALYYVICKKYGLDYEDLIKTKATLERGEAIMDFPKPRNYRQ